VESDGSVAAAPVEGTEAVAAVRAVLLMDYVEELVRWAVGAFDAPVMLGECFLEGSGWERPPPNSVTGEAAAVLGPDATSSARPIA
jgi:hypothetical protein